MLNYFLPKSFFIKNFSPKNKKQITKRTLDQRPLPATDTHPRWQRQSDNCRSPAIRSRNLRVSCPQCHLNHRHYKPHCCAWWVWQRLDCSIGWLIDQWINWLIVEWINWLIDGLMTDWLIIWLIDGLNFVCNQLAEEGLEL